jgi:hypothetical protein
MNHFMLQLQIAFLIEVDVTIKHNVQTAYVLIRKILQ